jgi:hypothetical protein
MRRGTAQTDSSASRKVNREPPDFIWAHFLPFG